MLTNYICLLDAMFESDCPHLINAVQLWDGLVQHERVLESKITPTLMIHLLWKVHQDAWQFLTREAPRNKPPGGGHGKQATKKLSIPSICAATVQKFNRLHPTLNISSFVCKVGLQYSDVKVGSADDCTSFGLLGRCTETCRYRHRVVRVPDEHAQMIKTALERSMTKLVVDASPA